MTTYHPSLSVFITNKTTSGVEKHHESTEPGKMISFFRRASSNLRELLTVVYARNSSILYGAVHNPIMSRTSCRKSLPALILRDIASFVNSKTIYRLLIGKTRTAVRTPLMATARFHPSCH